jgi:hypothetical protein
MQMAAARQQQRQNLMLAALSDQLPQGAAFPGEGPYTRPQQQQQQGQPASAYSGEQYGYPYAYDAAQQKQQKQQQQAGPLVITWFSSTTTTTGPYSQEDGQQQQRSQQQSRQADDRSISSSAITLPGSAAGTSNADSAVTPADRFFQMFEDRAPLDLDLELPPLTLSDLSLFDSADGSLRTDVAILLILMGACLGMVVGVAHSWCALRRVIRTVAGGNDSDDDHSDQSSNRTPHSRFWGHNHSSSRPGLLVPLLMADGEPGYILVNNPVTALPPHPHSPRKSLTAPQPAAGSEKAAAQAEWAARQKAKLQAAVAAPAEQQQQAGVQNAGVVVAADHVPREQVAGARTLPQ